MCQTSCLACSTNLVMHCSTVCHMVLLQDWKERFHADRTAKDTADVLKAITQVEADLEIARRMQSEYNPSARAATQHSGSRVTAQSPQSSHDAAWSLSLKARHSANTTGKQTGIHGKNPIPPSHRPPAPLPKQLAASRDRPSNSASPAETAAAKPSSQVTAASAKPKMPGVQVVPAAKVKITSAVGAVPSATAETGPAQSASSHSCRSCLESSCC